jgi:hypothetical protein
VTRAVLPAEPEPDPAPPVPAVPVPVDGRVPPAAAIVVVVAQTVVEVELGRVLVVEVVEVLLVDDDVVLLVDVVEVLEVLDVEVVGPATPQLVVGGPGGAKPFTGAAGAVVVADGVVAVGAALCDADVAPVVVRAAPDELLAPVVGAPVVATLV